MKLIRPQLPAILALLTTVAPGASAQDALDPYRKAPVTVPAQQTSNQILVSVETQSFSLPIDDAFKLLREYPTDSARFGRLIKLIEEGKARLERLLVLRTKSGQSSTLESIDEVRYAGEYGLSSAPSVTSAPKSPTPEPDKDLQPFPRTFETRNSGDTVEGEAILRPDDATVDLNLDLSTVQYLGQRDTEGARGFHQPVFGTQRVRTKVTARIGAPLLISIATPAFNSGLAKEEQERRVWLKFATVQTVAPTGDPFQESDGPTAAAAKAAIIGIDFVNATPKEAVEMLRAKSAEHSPDGKGMNIVLKLPPSLEQARVNLSLKVVSIYDALRYMAATIGAEVTAEDRALIVHVKGDRP